VCPKFTPIGAQEFIAAIQSRGCKFSPRQNSIPNSRAELSLLTVQLPTTAEYKTARRICEMTIGDIVASVPYRFGWHRKLRKNLGAPPDLSEFLCGDDGPLRVLPAMIIIWPLTCMNSHDYMSDEQRA